MFTTRKEVDAHVHKMLGKLQPGREVNKRPKCASEFPKRKSLRNLQAPPLKAHRCVRAASACVCVCESASLGRRF